MIVFLKVFSLKLFSLFSNCFQYFVLIFHPCRYRLLGILAFYSIFWSVFSSIQTFSVSDMRKGNATDDYSWKCNMQDQGVNRDENNGLPEKYNWWEETIVNDVVIIKDVLLKAKEANWLQDWLKNQVRLIFVHIHIIMTWLLEKSWLHSTKYFT